MGRAEIVLTAEILRCAQDDKRISSGGLNACGHGAQRGCAPTVARSLNRDEGLVEFFAGEVEEAGGQEDEHE